MTGTGSDPILSADPGAGIGADPGASSLGITGLTPSASPDRVATPGSNGGGASPRISGTGSFGRGADSGGFNVRDRNPGGPGGANPRILGTGGASLGARGGAGNAPAPIAPRTLEPGGTSKLLAGGGNTAGFDRNASAGSPEGVTPAGAVVGRTDPAAGDLGGNSAGALDYTHRGRLSEERGEYYGGDYYEGGDHGHDPYYGDHHHHHYYSYAWPWCFNYGWYGYYGWPSWGFGFGFYWPHYYAYGGFWPYWYAYSYPFDRVYHYGYTSYLPERVVIYENYYYDSVGDGGYYEEVPVDGAPVDGGGVAGGVVGEVAPAAGAAGGLPDDPLVTGDVMLRAGRYTEAVEAYRDAVDAEPDNSIAKFALADALFAMGEYHEAAYLARLGLAQDPDWLGATVSKGDLFPSVDEFERLLASLEAFAAERDYDSSAWFLLGYQQHFSRKYTAARSSMTKVAGILVGDPLTQRVLLAIDEAKARADAEAESEATAEEATGGVAEPEATEGGD